jgi:squalene-hopene/tetraprenyl-beta-curcumene cyclase
MKRSAAVMNILASTFLVLATPGIVSAEDEAPPSAADVEKKALETVRKGVAWLMQQQKENGSWSNTNFPAMTALGLWAVSRSDHPDRAAVCAKAASFIEGFVQDDGGIYKIATGGRGSGGLATYNTALCMTALHSYDRRKYAPVILKAREFVAGSQLQGDSDDKGGFGYEHASQNKKKRGDLSNSGWALMSMRITQDVEDLRPEGSKQVDVDWDAALKYMAKLQNSDKDDEEHFGGFGYERRGFIGGLFTRKKDGVVKLRGYGSMTYAGLEAMIYAQVDRNDPRVQSAVKWATRHWSVDENPGMGNNGLFYYLNVMSKALSLYGDGQLTDESGDPISWKQQLVEKMADIQKPDGSWVNKSNRFWEGDPVLVTAYSILSLEYILGQ